MSISILTYNLRSILPKQIFLQNTTNNPKVLLCLDLQQLKIRAYRAYNNVKLYTDMELRGVYMMELLYGLKKLFSRHRKFAPPNEYRLTPRERESVIVFFSVVISCLLVVLIIKMIY